MKILPAITTTGQTDWREKIVELNKLDLTEVCFFPTGLASTERQEAYKLLKKSKIKSIPFVHLRSDMSPDEIEFLIANFKTNIFNIHAMSEWPLQYDLSKYLSQMYLENSAYPMPEAEVKQLAGVCLDYAHLESRRLEGSPLYSAQYQLFKKYPIGCAHISALSQQAYYNPERKEIQHDLHRYANLNQFDYLESYKNFLAPLVAMELTNSISEQLVAIEYIKKIFK
ncbi:MAG: hypothetical protein WCW02_00690 [Candidatus Buchananbacteria bacterium]